MLFEPGPLALFTAAEVPVAGPPPRFEALAADQVRALEGAADAIARVQAEIASGGAVDFDPSAVQDLATAAAEHDHQSRAFDPALGGVAANAETLESELAGLVIEIAEDLNLAEPEEPTIPPGTDGGGPPPPSLSEWDNQTRFLFTILVARKATDAEVEYARKFYPDKAAREAWILTGAVVPPGGGPAPTPPAPAPGNGLVAIYRGYLASWIRENFRREPEEAELVDIDRLYARDGTITGESYNQLLAESYIPRL